MREVDRVAAQKLLVLTKAYLLDVTGRGDTSPLDVGVLCINRLTTSLHLTAPNASL